MALTTTQVSELYVAIFNRASEKAGNAYWAGLDASAATIAQSMLDTTDAKTYFGTSLDSNQAFIELIYKNTLNKTYAQDTAGVDYWVSLLATQTRGEVVSKLVASVKDYATSTDAATKAAYDQFTGRVAVSDYTAAKLTAAPTDYATSLNFSSALSNLTTATAKIDALVAAAAVVPEVTGNTSYLSASTDRLDGTANNDTFEAFLSQNPTAGGVSNSLSSADKLDGKAGTDKLTAELVAEFFGATANHQIDVQPRTSNIEIVEIEARDLGLNAGLEVGGESSLTVDAKYMTEVKKIGSKFSDGDLIIENLTTLKNGQIDAVSSMTITMDHTDNLDSDGDASDLTVYFDEDYLTTVTEYGQSGIVIRMMNQDAYDHNGGINRLDGVYVREMAFTLEGVVYDLAPFIIEDEVNGKGAEFKTEAELVAHLNAVALPSLKAAHPTVEAMNTLVFSIGGKWSDVDQNRIGDEIILSVSNKYTLTIGDASLELGQADGVADSYASNRIERTDKYTGANSESISINVELTKVGRDGEGGNLVIGGKDQDINNGVNEIGTSDTDVDQTDGIPTFNVTVFGDANLPSNLGRITSTNDALKTINIVSATNTAVGATFAALTVRGEQGSNDAASEETLTPFGGDLVTLNAAEFKGHLNVGQDSSAMNIDTITATGGGNVNFTHTTTVDGTFMLTTAGGTDTVNLLIDMSDSAIHTYSNTVNTGAANDTVNLTYSDQTVTNFLNTHQINQVSINTDSGSDTVTIGANDGIYSTATVNTGADADTIIISNDATKSSWIFNADYVASAASYLGRGDVQHEVFKAKLAVEFQGLTTAFVEVTYDTTTYKTSSTAINDAIKYAISHDAELVKLLTTTNLRDNGLQITSLVDRALDLNDLNIVFLAPKYDNYKASGNSATALEQDDNAIYANDSAEIFAARLLTDASEMGTAYKAWFKGSSGVDGSLTTLTDVSQSVTGDAIYGAAGFGGTDASGSETNLYESMFFAMDSDDVNSSSFSGLVDVDPATDDANNDLNMAYSATFGYNKLSVTMGTDNNEISMSTITAGAGDDLIVLNSNNTANSGFETLVLTAGFGTDTVLNFHTATATATADVIDYSVFLDPTAAARAESADAQTLRINQKVGFEFHNIVNDENYGLAADGGDATNHITAGGLTGIIDHNSVITIELSDLFDSLQVGSETVSDYSQITDTMITTALNAMIDDADYQTADDNALTAGAVTESGMASSKVVFNVVYDRQIEQSTADATSYVMGDDTDYHTMAVYSANVSYSATAAADGDNLSLSSVTKQGVLDFGDMYSTLRATDFTDVTMKGDAQQAAEATTEVSVLTGATTAPVTPETPVVTPTTVTLTDGSSNDAGTGAVVYNLSVVEGNVYAANISNFSGDDAINIDNTYTATNMLFDTTGANQINVAFGDMTDFNPSFTLNINVTDAALVTAVETASHTNAATALGVLNAAWGTDWLV